MKDSRSLLSTAVASCVCGRFHTAFLFTIDIRRNASDELRDVIQGGPPPGILSRFHDLRKWKEDAMHTQALEVMRELGWNTTD